MEYVRAARLVARHTRAYLDDVVPLAREAVVATVAAVAVYLKLSYELLRPIIFVLPHLYRAARPRLLRVFHLLWLAFASQPPRILAVEAALAPILVTLLLLERRFRVYARLTGAVRRVFTVAARRYRGFHDQVRSKSILAGAALPHIVFWAVAAIFQVFFGELFARVSGGGLVTVLLACVRPAYISFSLLYTVDLSPIPNESQHSDGETQRLVQQDTSITTASDGSPDTNGTPVLRKRRSVRIASTPRSASARRGLKGTPKRASSQSDISSGLDDDDDDDSPERESLEIFILRFWVVFGLVWAARSISWYFCPPALVLHRFLANVDIMLFYFFLWAQLWFTRGANIVYGIITGLSGGRWRTGPSDERVNVALRLAVATGMLSDQRAESLSNTFTESGLALVGILFLITPRWVTFIGTVLIGLLVPCYLSAGVLERQGVAARHNWLAYWGVYSLIDASFSAASSSVGWLPLWYHVKICVILWLQLPYYRGCVTVLDWIMGHVGKAMSSVHRQTVTPRKRKRA